MRGRKPNPTAFKILRGNPGKRPLNRDEPTPDAVEVLDPPAWLGTEAQAEWRRVSVELAQLGLLTKIDVDALAIYCQAFARWREAEQEITRLGLVVKSKTGTIVNPFLSVARKETATCMKILTEFGMTPSSRSRVSVKNKKAPASKLDRFVKIRA